MSVYRQYLEVCEKPWGVYYVYEDTPSYKLKRLVVNPGQRLSLQSHQFRLEHWFVIKGEATVEIEDEQGKINKSKLSVGEKCFIPLKAKHRLSNESEEVLEIIEIQMGTYFGEDDIIRYEDDYNRI